MESALNRGSAADDASHVVQPGGEAFMSQRANHEAPAVFPSDFPSPSSVPRGVTSPDTGALLGLLSHLTSEFGLVRPPE